MAENYGSVSSGFIGSYRTVYLRNFSGKPIVCESFGDNTTIDASRVNTFDGKGLSTIESLGSMTQSITINNAPVIIGNNNNVLDARDLFFYELENLFPLVRGISTPYELPLMKSTSLSISEQEATMTYNLISDGVRCHAFGSNREIFLTRFSGDSLDYCSYPNRVAYNQDFIFAFGPYKAFIIDGSFSVDVDIRSFPVNRQTRIDSISQSNPLNNCDSNRQYKILVPGKVTINATGTALVDIEDCIFDTNYSSEGYANLSKQDPGVLNIFKQNIFRQSSLGIPLPLGNQFELYFQPSPGVYEKFFRTFGRVGIEIISSHIPVLDLSATTDQIMVKFSCELQGQLSIF